MGTLMAAAGRVDLDPPVGTWLTGYGDRLQGSTGVHDPIMARAVVVSDGDHTVAVVSCEVVGWAPSDDMSMRFEIRKRCRIEATHILINCTHTHSGPASMPLRGNMGILNREWIASAQAKVVDLVASLPAKMVPVRTAYGETEVKGIGFNRQDGDGPRDETLQILVLENLEGEAVASLTCYNCHAVVLGPSNLLLSGDFPGAFCRQMEARHGGVRLYLQGCCGDIDPALNRDAWGTGTFDDCEAIGKRLADAAVQSVEGTRRQADTTVMASAAYPTFELKPPPDNLAEMAAGFQEQCEKAENEEARVCARAMLDWAAELQVWIASGEGVPALPTTVTALTIGEVALVGLPFEVYTQIGLDIKSNPWSRHTMVLGYTNGLNGYCTTDEARRKGGYGPEGSHRWFPTLPTPLPDGADAILIEAAKKAISACR
jgi:neutral ceramidase